MSAAEGTDHYDASYDARDEPRAKTSAAAAFGLIFGLAALIFALSLIFSPLALPFGILGLVLGVIGSRRARRPFVTGRALAVGGIVMSVIALLIALAIVTGIAVFKDNRDVVNQLNKQLDRISKQIPTQVPTPAG